MKHLVKAAEELNEVLGIEPAISTERINAPALEKNLKTAASLIDWDMDEISEDTKAALSSIGVKVPNMKKETPEEIDLVSVVLNTNELKTLKSLVKEHAVFTPLRKRIPGMFDPEELKEEMSKLLNVSDVEIALETELEKEVSVDDNEIIPEKKKQSLKKEKKQPKEEGKKLQTNSKRPPLKERIDFFTSLIEQGKYTRKELIEKGVKNFPTVPPFSLGIILSDAKNPKYNKFPHPVEQRTDGIFVFLKTKN